MGGKDDKRARKHRYSSMPDGRRQMDYGKLCPNGIMVNSVYNLLSSSKMSFYTPEFGIKHYNDIPTLCSGCGVHATWTDLTQKAKERLIEASSFYSLTAELVLLKRLNDLIALFPDTKHPLIHDKRRKSKRNGEPEDDVRIERLLDQDHELREFLTNCGFDLDARTSFVEERLNTIRFATGHPDIACRQCGAYCYLPESFLMEVGSYLERLAEDGG